MGDVKSFNVGGGSLAAKVLPLLPADFAKRRDIDLKLCPDIAESPRHIRRADLLPRNGVAS